MYANSEGSGETARMRRLAWAFAGRICDKYQNLMDWLISWLTNALSHEHSHVQEKKRTDLFMISSQGYPQ